MSVNIQRITQLAVLAFSLLMVSCGGGGSGGETPTPNNPGNPNEPNNPPPATVVTAFGFSAETSDVLFVGLPDESNGSSMVVMRHAGKERVVFLLDDGTLVEATQDDDGRLGLLTIGDHQITLTDYTETTVTVTYVAPGGATVSELVDLASGEAVETLAAPRRSFKPMANPTIAEYLSEVTDDTLAWLRDASNTYLPLIILRTAGESVADMYETARSRLESLRASNAEMAAVVQNPVKCDVTPDACAVMVVDNIPSVMQELGALDPAGTTSAGFAVTATGMLPEREQWQGEAGVDFSRLDVACGQSIFADMNPDCPQYIPPTTDPGEEPLSASDLIVHTAVNTPFTGELGASGATAYQLQSQPAHGTVSITQATGGFVYTPETDYVGIDSFTFVATNGDQTSRVATVTIEVGDFAREAIDSTISTAMNTAVSSSFQHVGATYFRVVQQPQNGTLTALNLTEGTFTYTPNTGFTGSDEIHFVAANASGDSEPAIVTINVGSAIADCSHSINNGLSMYRCEDFTEYWWGDMATAGGFTREEAQPGGEHFGNSWYIQIENNEIVVYGVEHYVYENGRIVRIESFHLSVGVNNTHNEMDHRVEVRTFNGNTRTSTTRTLIDCSNYEVRRRVYEGQFSTSPVEDEYYDTREICPTVEDAQALATAVMTNADMSISHAASSPAYTLANPAP